MDDAGVQSSISKQLIPLPTPAYKSHAASLSVVVMAFSKLVRDVVTRPLLGGMLLTDVAVLAANGSSWSDQPQGAGTAPYRVSFETKPHSLTRYSGNSSQGPSTRRCRPPSPSQKRGSVSAASAIALISVPQAAARPEPLRILRRGGIDAKDDAKNVPWIRCSG